jgi:hypothetical protein
MGRSVSYLSNAEYVLYFPTPEATNEEGEYDGEVTQMYWDDLVSNLICEIKGKLKSYYEEDSKWDNRETRIILSNNLCNIGISEYCGLTSLSIAVRNNDYYDNEALAKHHAQQIRKTLEKIVDDLTGERLVKQGTFSNGESVYQKVN